MKSVPSENTTAHKSINSELYIASISSGQVEYLQHKSMNSESYIALIQIVNSTNSEFYLAVRNNTSSYRTQALVHDRGSCQVRLPHG